MKHLLFLIVSIVLLQITIGNNYAQESTSFVYIDDKPDHQRPMSMVEFQNFYIILSSQFTISKSNEYNFLLKINKQGHKIDEKIVVNPYNKTNTDAIFRCRQMVKLPDNNIAILGSINREDNPAIYDFYYAIYDSNLNKISENFIYKPYGEPIQTNAFLNSKGNIILHGGLSPDSNPSITNHCFIAEFSVDGQLLNLYINDIKVLYGVIWDIVEEADGSYLAAQDNQLQNNNGLIQDASFCRFNHDLSIKHPYFNFNYVNYGDIIPASDTSFILVSREPNYNYKENQTSHSRLSPNFFSIFTFDTACQLIDSSHSGDTSPNAVNNPSIWQCADIDKTNPNAFFASDFSPMSSDPFYDGPSTIFTYKFNTDGTKLWEAKYGGPDSAAYFKGYATYATQDGGVLLLNTRHAFYSGNDADVLIIKYDKDGALSIKENELQTQTINCYPNPTSSELHIDIPISNGKPYLLKIYDICGKLIMEKPLYNTNNTIDISQYSNGIYTYSLQQKQQTIVHGKWVKR